MSQHPDFRQAQPLDAPSSKTDPQNMAFKPKTAAEAHFESFESMDCAFPKSGSVFFPV
jgi:hypothetical protein